MYFFLPSCCPRVSSHFASHGRARFIKPQHVEKNILFFLILFFLTRGNRASFAKDDKKKKKFEKINMVFLGEVRQLWTLQTNNDFFYAIVFYNIIYNFISLSGKILKNSNFFGFFFCKHRNFLELVECILREILVNFL